MMLHGPFGFNDTDAAGLFQEALKLDPKNARAELGLALVSHQGQDDKAAKDELNLALGFDPKLYEAHEVLAWIALEDSDNETATKEATDAALAISPDALYGYASYAAMRR